MLGLSFWEDHLLCLKGNRKDYEAHVENPHTNTHESVIGKLTLLCYWHSSCVRYWPQKLLCCPTYFKSDSLSLVRLYSDDQEALFGGVYHIPCLI